MLSTKRQIGDMGFREKKNWLCIPLSFVLTVIFPGLALATENAFPLEPVPVASSFGESIDLRGLSTIRWLPQGNNCKAVLLCVHGVSMWSGSFRHFAEQMARQGVATYAVDAPGFGPYSIVDGQWMAADAGKIVPAIRLLVEDLHARHPGSPLFVLGESMGACVAIRLGIICQGELDGIICSAPALRIYGRNYLLMNTLVKLLLRRKQPFEQSISQLIKRATDDPDIHARWRENPEYRFQFSKREVFRGISFLLKTGSYAPHIKRIPVLMIQGLNDRIVKPKGAAVFFKRIAVHSKEFVLISNSEHLIFEEVKPNNAVVSLVCDWIGRQSASSQRASEPTGVLIGSSLSRRVKRLFHQARIESPSILDSTAVGQSNTQTSNAKKCRLHMAAGGQ